MKPLEQLADVVVGKSVALVGNASSLFDKPRNIDAHDVVVRINNGPFSEDERGRAGRRTDVLLVSGMRGEKYLDCAPHVTWMTPKGRDKLTPAEASRMYFYPEEWWTELFREIGDRPSTGCMGIDMLSRLIGPGALYLYGFDFWKSPTWYTGKIHLGPHNPSSEEVYARRQIPASHIIA